MRGVYERGLSLLTHPCYLGYKGAVGCMCSYIGIAQPKDSEQNNYKLEHCGASLSKQRKAASFVKLRSSPVHCQITVIRIMRVCS